MTPRTYRLLRRALGPAPSTRDTIVTMIVLAALVTALAIAQIARRHQVVRAGYALSRESQQLERLRERRRALEVERATLTHPERLRALATRMGMVPAEPEQIRVVRPRGEAPR
jgi:cell division protein FtsL